MVVEASRTYHANQAVQLTELLSIRFAAESFGTNTRRILHVAEPDGPSTDGGRKARQPIMLVPEAEGEGANIVCGWLDVAKHTAEIRGFAVLTHQHQARYHTSVDISRGEYDRFVQELLDFLKMQGIDTRLNNVPPERQASLSQAPGPIVAKSTNQTIMLAAALGVVIGFALGFIVFGLPGLL